MASVPELSCTVYTDQYSVNHEVCEYSTINELKENDVICGRGKHCFNHPGNRKFRYLVETFLSSYAEASCKLEKSIVVSRIVDEVRRNSPNGGFVKQDYNSGHWREVGDRLAREKVGQVLRDSLHYYYRSSTESKRKRRKVEQVEQQDRMSLMIDRNEKVRAVMTKLVQEISDDLPDLYVGALFNAANAAILCEFKLIESSWPHLKA